MPCPHSFTTLFHQTSFASDGPTVQQAREEKSVHDTRMSLAQAQQMQQSTMQMAASMQGGIPLIAPPVEMPTFSPAVVRKPTDASMRLSKIKPLLREYGSYTCPHEEVLDALLHFLGDAVFEHDTRPADAFAFATVTGTLFYFAELSGLAESAPSDARKKAKVASDIIAQLTDEAEEKVKQKLQQSNIFPRFSFLYKYLVNCRDLSSTVFTDAIWTFGLVTILQALDAKLDHLNTLCKSVVGDFVAFSRAVNELTEELESPYLTHTGHLYESGSLYKIVGFSQQGIMVTVVQEGVKEPAEKLETFCGHLKVVKRLNIKSAKEKCAGCCLRIEGKGERLFCFTNPLISCDSASAKDFSIQQDGMVTFTAESFLVDRQTSKVLRAGRSRHTAEVFEMHSLYGFDLKKCSSVSFLVESVEKPLITSVESKGVVVRSMIERMDEYDADDQGRIVSVTYGSVTKRAKIRFGSLSWEDTGCDGFTLGDIVC